MNVITRGIRNAFRNMIRTFSIVTILGLSIGLSLVMLIAHQAVGDKIESVKQSIGNTISVHPAGFVGTSQANNALAASQLDKVRKLAHVTGVTKLLDGHLTTIGSNSTPGAPAGSESSTSKSVGSEGSTTLKSPIKIDKNGSGGGMSLNVSGGDAPALPANFSPPISAVGTTNPLGSIGEINAQVKLTKGHSIDGNKDSNEALISEAMAAKNNLKVGDTFTAYGATIKVVGLFTTGTDAGDNFVILSLPTMQRLSNNPKATTGATVTVDSVSNIDSVTDAVKKVLGSSADITSSKKMVENAIKPLQSILSVSLYSLVGAIFAGAVITLLTMIMIVRERRREIGIIKAIGFSNIRIMFQFMIEALTLTILGAGIGLIVGVSAGGSITKSLVDNTNNNGNNPSSGGPGMSVSIQENTIAGIRDVQTQIGWEIILEGIGAAVLISIIGSGVASFFIAKVRPAEVLRSE